MRHKGLFAICLGAVFSAVMAAEVQATSYDVDAFVDDLLNNATLYDIGQRTSDINPATNPPPLPPTAPINNAIFSGRVRGQFEYTCGDPGPNNIFGPEDCPDAAYAAAAFNWKWGVLQVTDGSGYPNINAAFVDVGGTDFFPSDVSPATKGFTSVDTNDLAGSNSDPAARIIHFEFNIQSAGMVLPAGYSYIIFAMYSPSNITLGNRVPGEGPGFGFGASAEESIYFTSVLDSPPYQLHQAFPQFDPDGSTNQLATSRLIPVTPEPATLTLMLLGVGAVIARRNPRRVS